MATSMAIEKHQVEWAAHHLSLALGGIAADIAGSWADHLGRLGKPELSQTWRQVEQRLETAPAE
ncbi:MAG: hypothetical protein P1U37_19185 [Minwuia sp.]|nr:hypothetical protein [Minwuia sp.]